MVLSYKFLDFFFWNKFVTENVNGMFRVPGKAYARRQHVWLTGANEVDSKTFSRAILAKVPSQFSFRPRFTY